MAYSSIKAKKGKDFKQVDPGIHLGICYQVIALGNQEFRGKVNPKVWLGFELPDVPMDDGRPMTMGKEFSLYVGGKSKLGEALQNWRGKQFTEAELEAFEVTSVAGKICQLNVGYRETDKTKTEIKDILGLINAQKQLIKEGKINPNPVNRVVVYNPDDHDPSVWADVPKFLQTKIEGRIREDKTSYADTQEAVTTEDWDDDIPF
jgi:hypothetical protein